MTLDRLYFC